MKNKKLDRRVVRTRALLNNALMTLIAEKGYDNVTIEDITERANLGRTTFYLHYPSKDALFLDHHANFAADIFIDELSRNQLLGSEPWTQLAEFLEQLKEGKEMVLTILQSKDGSIIRRNISETLRGDLAQSLAQAFPNVAPKLPLDYLTYYLANAQLSMVEWWLNNRTGYSANEIAAMVQQCMASIVKGAYQCTD